MTTAFYIGGLVAVVKKRPILRPDFGPCARCQAYPLRRDPLPLPADIFALATAEQAQKVIETAVVPVKPVKLAGRAFHQFQSGQAVGGAVVCK